MLTPGQVSVHVAIRIGRPCSPRGTGSRVYPRRTSPDRSNSRSFPHTHPRSYFRPSVQIAVSCGVGHGIGLSASVARRRCDSDRPVSLPLDPAGDSTLPPTSTPSQPYGLRQGGFVTPWTPTRHAGGSSGLSKPGGGRSGGRRHTVALVRSYCTGCYSPTVPTVSVEIETLWSARQPPCHTLEL